MAFKDFLSKDNEVFFNTSEFGEVHNIADKDCTIVLVEDDKTNSKPQLDDDYTNINSIKFVILKSELGFKPSVGRQLKYDNKALTVLEITEQGDSYVITLEAYVE